MILPDFPRQKTTLQRAVGQNSLIVVTAPGNQLLFYIPPDHTVWDLIGCECQELFCFDHLLPVVVADSGFTDFSLFLQSDDGLHRLFYRRGQIRPVDLIEINVVCIKPSQTIFTLLDHILFRRIDVGVDHLPVVIDTLTVVRSFGRIPPEPELGQNLKPVTGNIPYSFTDYLLTQALSVNRRGIYGGHPEIIRGFDRLCSFLAICSTPHPATGSPGSKGDD